MKEKELIDLEKYRVKTPRVKLSFNEIKGMAIWIGSLALIYLSLNFIDGCGGEKSQSDLNSLQPKNFSITLDN